MDEPYDYDIYMPPDDFQLMEPYEDEFDRRVEMPFLSTLPVDEPMENPNWSEEHARILRIEGVSIDDVDHHGINLGGGKARALRSEPIKLDRDDLKLGVKNSV